MPTPKEQDTDAEVAAADIAHAIRKIDAGIRKMNQAGLSERAIVTLINDVTGGHKHGVSKENIRRVLQALPRLKAEYLA